MPDEDSRAPRFGCGRCWPDSAEAAYEALKLLTTETVLIDESHFRVTIRVCPDCTQPFVSIFTETVDWDGGEDPQYRTLLPLTPAEANDLTQRGDGTTEAALNAVGRSRKSLRHDWPKGVEPRSYWATGIAVGPHD